MIKIKPPRLDKKSLIEMEKEEHKAYHRRLFYVFMLIVFMLSLGTLFYHHVEGWRYLDAAYFSSYTITTVGYGEFVPKTDLGKLFTIFYMCSGVSLALYGLSLMASHFVEVREEFWLEKLIKINIAKPKGIARFKNFLKSFSFSSEKLVEGYEQMQKRSK